jgi:hypothetical protein
VNDKQRRKLIFDLAKDAIGEGDTPPRTFHLGPPRELGLPGTPGWSTRCGLEWAGRRWYHVVFGYPSTSDRWCDDCLAQAGLHLKPLTDDLYELAVRTWIARSWSNRDRSLAADAVRNVGYGIDYGYEGSDVTPADDPEPTIECEVRVDGKWTLAEIGLPKPTVLVQECLAIAEQLRLERL